MRKLPSLIRSHYSATTKTASVKSHPYSFFQVGRLALRWTWFENSAIERWSTLDNSENQMGNTLNTPPMTKLTLMNLISNTLLSFLFRLLLRCCWVWGDVGSLMIWYAFFRNPEHLCFVSKINNDWEHLDLLVGRNNGKSSLARRAMDETESSVRIAPPWWRISLVKK